MAKIFVGLLLLGTVSFSLYLTPAPANNKSVFPFLAFFLLLSSSIIGLLMTLPFFFDWRLPLQQGLGSNQQLLLRGGLLAAAPLFFILVGKQKSLERFSWLAAIVLIAVGIPEFLRVLDLLNLTVNGLLASENGFARHMYGIIYPYLALLCASSILILIGCVSLSAETFHAFIAQSNHVKDLHR